MCKEIIYMKRRILMIIIVIILACLAVVFAGCDKKPAQDKGYKLMSEQVSYIENSIYSGEDKSYSAKLIIGAKEESFIADGKVVNVKPFSTLAVTPLNMDGASKQYTYSLVGSKGEVTGSLQKNLLGASYGVNFKFDSGTLIDSIGDPIKLVITNDKTSVDIELVNNIKDFITPDKAIEYTYGAMQEYVKSCLVDGRLDGEVYVRLLKDRASSTPKYYWYVAIMRDSKSFANALIDPKSGAVVTVKLPQETK